jgi:hypothetical protein
MSFTFDPKDYDERPNTREKKTYDPIPPGWYSATIKDVTTREWDDPPGKSLQLVWQVSKGEHKGRLHWHTLNVEHKDPTRELKARYMLSDICNAVGILALDSPIDLVGYECEIELIILAPQPPKYPTAKNWVSSVRLPKDTAVAVSGEQPLSVVRMQVDFDDDEIPF